MRQKAEPVVTITDKKKPKRNVPLLVCCLVIFFLIIIALIVKHINDNKIKSPTVNVPSSLSSKMSSTQLAQYYADRGAYNQAQNVYNSELKHANKQGKISIYYLQSSLALQFKYYPEATSYANKINAVSPNVSTYYVALANIATAQNNTSLAITDWNKAIDNLNPKSPTYNIDKSDYNSNISSLQ